MLWESLSQMQPNVSCVLFVGRLTGVLASSISNKSLKATSPSTSSTHCCHLFSHEQQCWTNNKVQSTLCTDEMREKVLCVLRQIVWFAKTSISIMSALRDPLSLVLTLSLSPATCVAICSRLMWVTSSNWSICSSGVHPFLWHSNI